MPKRSVRKTQRRKNTLRRKNILKRKNKAAVATNSQFMDKQISFQRQNVERAYQEYKEELKKLREMEAERKGN